MIIENIHIENFRSLRDVDINCDTLTAIIGRNGTGKSTVLYALDAFYNVGAQFTEYDYFSKNTDAEIKIRITYGNLRDDEKEEFKSHLKDNNLTVTKVINAGGAKYYGASRQIPEFQELRKEAATPKRTKFNELVESAKYPGLGPKARKADEVDSTMERYETDHPELLETFETPQQFIGPRNIGGGKLDKYTKFVLIPAVRDASAETDRKGVILQLIDVLVTRSVNKRPDVRQLNEEFERRVREVYSRENLEELGKLAGMITELLSQYAPGAELDLAFGEVIPPKINLPPAIASLVEDNFKCLVSYTGHGLQRALIFALLQRLSLTDMSPDPVIKEEPAEQVKQGEELGPVHVPDLILGIEEPELYLHPARSRYLSDVMKKLSSPSGEEAEPRTQIFFATHSPYFIDLDLFDRVRLAKKCATDGCDVLQSRLTQYSRRQAATRLAAVNGRAPETFTEASFVAHAVPVMTSLVNEGFFADVVVVVEGLSDAAILWAVQQHMNKSWDGRGIVIVPVNGKNNIDRPIVVFQGLEIPTYFLFDGDSSHTGSKREKSIRSNEILLRLANADVVEFPVTQVHETWAVFNDKLEAELKVVGEELFDRLRSNISDEFGYGEPSKVIKNPQAAARFIQRIYEEGQRIIVLEDIIEKVTNLKNA
jgi:putative ATP-dependent endonuclease of the OLD family